MKYLITAVIETSVTPENQNNRNEYIEFTDAILNGIQNKLVDGEKILSYNLHQLNELPQPQSIVEVK